MFFNLLEETSEAAKKGGAWQTYVLLGALAAILILFWVFNSRSQKKRQKETQDMLNAVKPGNKVKTIGGICGVVVEVNEKDNTFVLETGTNKSGKSYLTFDKQAIYQTDAVAEKPATEKKETKKVEKAQEETVEEPVATETTEEKDPFENVEEKQD